MDSVRTYAAPHRIIAVTDAEANLDSYSRRGVVLSRDAASTAIAALSRDAASMRERGGTANEEEAAVCDALAQAIVAAVGQV